ncbi:hypothetical protein [Parvularcula oceani]|uniref:hypothetical protein n=1 Tax=Parvularcula oceani TaxID=1247963 RepID=UPI00068F7FB5|nr:hypothetical protein [Parvularcula oceani]
MSNPSPTEILLQAVALNGLAFGLALVTLLLCRLAGRARFVPDAVSARSNHTEPTSRAGGLIVALCFAAGAGGLAVAGYTSQAALNLLVLVAGAATVGFLDDVLDLSAPTKLVSLIVLGLLSALLCGPIAALPVPLLGWTALPAVLGYALAALWVLGFVNVFNFMDGLNGMAGTTGMVLLSGLALFCPGAGPAGGALYLAFLCLAGSLFGFLVRNIRRGAPFLGDAGSLGLGTGISAGALLLVREGGGGEIPYLLAVGAMPFLADVATTLVQRARRRAPLMQAHKEHAYQRLREAGYSHDAVSAAYGALSAVLVTLAVLLQPLAVPSVLVLLAAGGAAAWACLVRGMLRAKGYEARTEEERARSSSVSRSREGGNAPSEVAAASA